MSLLLSILKREYHLSSLSIYNNNHLHTFKNLKIYRVLDLYEPIHTISFLPESQKSRSPILQTVIANEYIVLLSKSGIAGIYNTDIFVKYLNPFPGDRIQNVYFNEVKNSIVLIYLTKKDNFSILRVVDISLLNFDWINNIFDSESLLYPGYIEWNKENIITYCGKTKIYKIWNHSYKVLFQLYDLCITDIRHGVDVFYIVFKKKGSNLPIRIISSSTGEHIYQFDLEINRNLNVEKIEFLNEFIYLKQSNVPPFVENIITKIRAILSDSFIFTESSFYPIFNYFLLLSNRHISVFNPTDTSIKNIKEFNILFHSINYESRKLFFCIEQDNSRIIKVVDLQNFAEASLNLNSELTAIELTSLFYNLYSIAYNHSSREVILSNNSGFTFLLKT